MRTNKRSWMNVVLALAPMALAAGQGSPPVDPERALLGRIDAVPAFQSAATGTGAISGDQALLGRTVRQVQVIATEREAPITADFALLGR
jgi:hypothetical protein